MIPLLVGLVEPLLPFVLISSLNDLLIDEAGFRLVLLLLFDELDEMLEPMDEAGEGDGDSLPFVDTTSFFSPLILFSFTSDDEQVDDRGEVDRDEEDD